MRYHPTHAAARARRSLSWQARSLIAAASVACLAGGGAVMAEAASAAPAVVTTVTGTTYLPDNGDNGNGAGNSGTWADDTFHRVLTVTSSSACSPAPVTGVTCYAASVSDSGTFKTLPGNGRAPNPNSTTDPGTNIAYPPVSGPFSGSATYLFETSAVPDASYIPGFLNNSGVYQSGATNKNSTSGWFANAFATGTTFLNSNGSPFTSAIQNTWAYSYTTQTGASATTTAVNCETWNDTAINGGGDTALDGNVIGTQCAGTPIPPVVKTRTGTIVDFSGKCLDVRNAFGHAAVGQQLQVWTCGVLGSEDQVFTLSAKGNHALTYQGLCVTEVGHNSRAVLETCNGSASQSVTYTKSRNYRFVTAGEVLDVSGFGRTNGTPVLIYAFNGGGNQGFSLPL